MLLRVLFVACLFVCWFVFVCLFVACGLFVALADSLDHLAEVFVCLFCCLFVCWLVGFAVLMTWKLRASSN